jgi:hypothetical protein
MSRADRTRDGTQITPIWRCTRSTGETVGAAPNGGSSRAWAGAQIVAATAWDLIDEADSWRLADEVVSVLIRPDPAAEWRERFIRHLAAWKSHTDPCPSPLSWGAVQFVGLGPR